MMLKDFGGLIIWAIVIGVILYLNKEREWFVRGDLIFISVVLLITIYLIWFRIAW